MRKMLFIFLCFFLTAVSLFSLIFLPFKKEDQVGDKKEYIEVWHIDSFEGGIGSRFSYIQKIANSYMKEKKVVVMVKSQTVFSALENFKKQIYPDIISYSNGLDLPYDKLLSLPKTVGGGYAQSWCSGGYLYITRKGVEAENLIVSTQKYTIPLLAIGFEGISLPIKCEMSSDKAIYEFYANKKSALIGTQRDLFRLENKGIEFTARPLVEYNDLYQYVSLLCESENYDTACAFLEYFWVKTDEDNGLKSIGMLKGNGYNERVCMPNLSCFNNVNYTYVTPVLISEEKIIELQNKSQNFINETESIKNALKRLK